MQYTKVGATHYGTIETLEFGIPKNADALPTFRVLSGTNLQLTSGTAAFLETGDITGATNATPIVITSANHKLASNARVTIANVGGNTAANGSWNITVINGNTFSLNGSTPNGNYTSGGTWNTSGLYGFSFLVDPGLGFVAGETYRIVQSAVTNTKAGAGVDVFGAS